MAEEVKVISSGRTTVHLPEATAGDWLTVENKESSVLIVVYNVKRSDDDGRVLSEDLAHISAGESKRFVGVGWHDDETDTDVAFWTVELTGRE